VFVDNIQSLTESENPPDDNNNIYYFIKTPFLIKCPKRCASLVTLTFNVA